MTSSQPLEPPKVLENIQSIECKKIRFELNKFHLPIGAVGTFGIIRHPGASLAVPIKRNGNIIILRQYRFAISRRILEFPAGTLEKHEDPLTTIKRELQEEAGYEANKWDDLGTMTPCPGYSDEVIHMFLARDLTPLINKPKGDEDEDIEVLEIKPKELNEIISNGTELLDGKSITAWHRTSQILGVN